MNGAAAAEDDVERRLLDAFESATRRVEREDIGVEWPTPGGQWSGKVAKVEVPEGGALDFFDTDGETVVEALRPHGWEVSSVDIRHGGGAVVNVWETEIEGEA